MMIDIAKHAITIRTIFYGVEEWYWVLFGLVAVFMVIPFSLSLLLQLVKCG
tara:strand:+ start:324 stop:476 length:153 start_codon:yes stop_codon:yes gene_type:complete